MLYLAGVRVRKSEELREQYHSDRLCLVVDAERVKTELAHLFFPPIRELRAQVERMRASGVLTSRLSASTCLDELESLSIQAVRGAVAISSRFPQHLLVKCYQGQPYFEELKKEFHEKQARGVRLRFIFQLQKFCCSMNMFYLLLNDLFCRSMMP